MYNEFGGTLSNLALAKHRKSRAINAENPKGEKGKGGMAASHLGPSRKGSPCLNDIASGQTVTLAEIEGPGAINHIWITVDAKTTDADCFVLRLSLIHIWFVGQAVKTPPSHGGNTGSIPVRTANNKKAPQALVL